MEINEYSLKDLVSALVKKWKYILYTTGVVAFLTVIVSLLLPIYYRTATVFYAASPDLGLPNSVSANELQRSVYGNDYDIDRLLAIANSEEVYHYLIDQFDLYTHYDIDTNDVRAAYYVREELKDRYKVLKTKLNSIELSVEDREAVRAANMANGARNKISEISQRLMKESQGQTLAAYTNNLEASKQASASLSDSIKFYRNKYGIIDIKSQSEVLAGIIANTRSSLEESKANKQFYETNRTKRDSLLKYTLRTNTLSTKLDGVLKEQENFNNGVTKLAQLEVEYDRLISQMALDVQRAKLLRSAYESPFTALHLVESANPPVIKSKPKRALIVLISSILAFILSCAFVLVSQNMSDWSWKSLMDEK